MSYQPFTIGRQFRIVPPDTLPLAGKIDLVMDRGAFGSGEHETTASCVERMESLDMADREFLDIGSGTGILSIAALKLGASHGLCVDIDPDAVESARLNSTLNGVAGELEHVCGTLDDVNADHRFDMVFANIYGDILLDICDELVARVKPGGILLLSGILWEFNYDVRHKYEKADCEILENRLLDEFSTVLLERKA